MITLFHLLQLIIPAGCAGVGCAIGLRSHGTLGAVLGMIIGIIAGIPLGRVPLLVAWYFGRPQRYSSRRLRHMARGPVWTYVHLALGELVRRGENVEQELAVVRDMLLSNDPWKRVHGYAALKAAAPELALQLGAFDPRAALTEVRTRVNQLPWPRVSSSRIVISRPLFELSEQLLAELRASGSANEEDAIVQEHDAFLLDGGLGPPAYLTASGCIIWHDDIWSVRGTRGDAIMAIGAGIRKLGLRGLRDLLPVRGDDAIDCDTCNGSGRFPPHGEWLDVDGKPISLICGHCAGLGWTAPSVALDEVVSEVS